MNFTNNIIINTYSVVLLIVLGVHAFRHTERVSVQNKLYFFILQTTIWMLFVDIFSRFDGKNETFYPVINQIGNFLIFLLSPVLPSLWLLYVWFQLFSEEEKPDLLLYPIISINVINTAILILSQFFGWYYYIDSNNIYHRGPLFLLSASMTFALILMSYILILANGKKVERKVYHSLLFFAVPPFICILLQTFFYGISLMLNSVVISLLIVFLNIQNRSIYIDYLTGVYNRKRLETHLLEKVNKSTVEKTFSAILIDLNDFKYINDSFGHDIGDNALEISAKLIKECLRANDFIARYGGDEFCVVLDVSNRIELEEIVYRINNSLEKYNESSLKPYKLTFSMGYAVYDYQAHMKVEEFQKYIDILMYENKRLNKNESVKQIYDKS